MKYRLDVLALAAISTLSFAGEQTANEQTAGEQASQSIELESVDVSLLKIDAVQKNLKADSDQIRQESAVGRSGLSGNCFMNFSWF